MDDHEEKLEQLIGDNKPFWRFHREFRKLSKRQHPDLPPLKSDSIVPGIRRLAKIFLYCDEHGQQPNAKLLMGAMDFGSPLAEKLDTYSETLSKHLRDCFNSAMQKIEIEKHTQELVEDSIDTEKEHGKPGRGEPRRRREEPNRRRHLVQAFAESKPQAKGENLDKLTCEDLDGYRIDFPTKWRAKFRVTSWSEAYEHEKLRPRIQTMFSKDRRKT